MTARLAQLLSRISLRGGFEMSANQWELSPGEQEIQPNHDEDLEEEIGNCVFYQFANHGMLLIFQLFDFFYRITHK